METKRYKRYDEMVKQATPGSPKVSGFFRAFWVGGLICAIGQLIMLAYEDWLGMTMQDAAGWTSATLIFIGTTLTGIGVYDDIGRFAGAGSVVPITGFANSVAAPAIEYRREGLVLGVGARLFTVAGPVLVYGIATSVVVGIIYFIAGRLGA